MASTNGIKFEPVRFSAALSILGTATITLLALLFTWAAPVVLAVSGVWAGIIGLLNTFTVRDSVTSNANVPGIVHDQIVSLAPYAPEVVNAIVPVATSPLINGPKVVEGTTGAVLADRPDT